MEGPPDHSVAMGARAPGRWPLRRATVSQTRWMDRDEVLRREERNFQQRRAAWQKLGVEASPETLGVCFSGGGIRSANLCLGALWRLAEEGILPHVSHLSAVSGGAYASAAFASDLVAGWRERPPRGGAEDVNRWYREAAKRTILRFQRNANHPLHAFRCISRMSNVWLKRALGIAVFVALCGFMLLGHPLTFILWFMMPLVFYFEQVYGPHLRFHLCAPPFTCLSDDCKVTGPRYEWGRIPTMLKSWSTTHLLIIAIFTSCLMLVLRLCGTMKEEGRQRASPGRRLLLHVLHGGDMLAKRLLLLFLLEGLVLALALGMQMHDEGSVSSVRGSAGPAGPGAGPAGWALGFDAAGRNFTTDLQDLEDDDTVLRFGSWFSCYNYTMDRWRDSGLLGVLDPNTEETSTVPAGEPEPECCMNTLHHHYGAAAGNGENETLGGRTQFWQDRSFGAFYWGNAGEPGLALAGQGPVDPGLRGFYHAWYGACAREHQAMCFQEAKGGPGARPVAGCCRRNFVPFLVSAVAALLALGCVLFLLAHSKRVIVIICTLAGPFAALYLVALCVVWRVFGPIYYAPLEGRVQLDGLGALMQGPTWNWLFRATLVLAIALLPLFDTIQRVSHLFYRACLVNAYFRAGEDLLLSEVEAVVACPSFLFGSTVMMYMSNYEQKHPYGRFCIGTYHIGCPQTRYVATPQSFQLARAMACSGAAMDTFLLTVGDHWTVRFWVLMLNLAQGDWLRFDPESAIRVQLPLNLAKGNFLSVDRWQRMIDAVPSLLAFMLCYLLLLASASADQSHQCRYSDALFSACGCAAALLFASTFFMPVCRCLMTFLQPSPLVRIMQMMLVATPVTDSEPPPYLYLGDGGLLENSGCLELLLRRVRFILVIEAGDDPNMELITLHLLMRYAEEEKICSFFVPGDPRVSVLEAVEDYRQDDTRTFLHLGILYDWGMPSQSRAVGDLYWVQNRPSGPRNWTARPQQGPFQAEFGAATPRCNPDPEDGGSNSEDCSESGSSSAGGTSDCEEPKGRPPLSALSECCWDGCSFPCGGFPSTSTANQFFSPKMAANYIHFGYHLCAEAVDSLLAASSAAAAATPREGQGAPPRPEA